MLDIKFVRANPDAVKENIKKKFQDEKLVLVDEVHGIGPAVAAQARRRADSLRGAAQRDLQADRRPDGSGQEGRG